VWRTAFVVACSAATAACTLPWQQLALPGPIAPEAGPGAIASGNWKPGTPLSTPAQEAVGDRVYPGTGQLTGRPEPRPLPANGKDGVVINLSGASIAEAARLVLGDTLGVNYVVSDKLKGSITMQTTKPVPREALLELFEMMLAGEGAAIVVDKGIYRVVPSAEAVAGAPLRVGGARRVPGMSTQIIPLQYVSAAEMERIVKSISPQSAILRVDATRNLLVVAEIALAVMLVIGAGLLIRTVYNLTSVDAGFDRSRLVTFSLTLPEPYDPDTRAPAYQRLLDKLRVTPGVQRAAIMSGLPPNRSPEAIPTRIDSHTASDGSPIEIIDYYQFVMGDYFGAMGVPIVAGRSFEPADAMSSGRVVIVNETLANRIWKGRSPIGQRIRPNLSAAIGVGDDSWHTVIGVAKDVKQGGVEKATGTELYVSLDQLGMTAPTMNVVLRTALPPAALSRTLERLVRDVDAAVPIVRLREMDAVFAESIRRPRLLAQLLGAFAGLALLLAAVGTYGVLSYMVTERHREIGVRMALGASRSSVIGLVMRQGLQATVIGVIVGVGAAFAANRMIASLLFGVQPSDAITMAGVIATISTVAAVACWLPGWRASRLDPNAVLKAD
jgi:predicted permease